MFNKQFFLKRIILKTIAFFLVITSLITVQSLFADDKASDGIIYFYPDTDVIKEKSYDTLKNLVSSLKNDENLKIKLNGFTNFIGEPDNELELSKKRAAKIALYLINEGIKEDRISTEGFGGTNLITNEITEINRRVEINVIKVEVKASEETAQVKAEENITEDNKNVESGYRRIKIEVYDINNKALAAELEVKKKVNDDLELLKSVVVKKSISIDVPVNENIELLATAKGYMPKKENLEKNENYKKIIMEKIEIGKAYSVDNIYFDSLKSSIKRESFDIINEIVNVLNDNPDMKVKVIGHTQAPAQKLSNERAKSVITYIKRRHISEDRLASEGNSNKALIGSSAKKQGIKNNMRVEFIFFK